MPFIESILYDKTCLKLKLYCFLPKGMTNRKKEKLKYNFGASNHIYT